MATIQKRTNAAGKTSYRAMIRVKGFPAESASFDRKTDAREWAAKTERAIRERRHFGTDRKHTFTELVGAYREAAAPRLKTWQVREDHLKRWREAFGAGCLLTEITPERIAAERDKLKTEATKRGSVRSGPTVARYLATLSACLSFAQKELHWIPSNPASQVRKPKEAPGRIRYLDQEEIPRLLDACRNSTCPDLLPAAVLALTTGGRREEILGLRWAQVDFQSRRITLKAGETKNGEGRPLPLSRQAFELLQERAKVRRLNDDRVFPPTARAKKAEYIDLRKPWETALKQAGIEDFHWHDLRHTAASYLAMSGVSPLEISKILGHKTMAMVSRYSHLAPDRVSELGDALADKLGLG